MTTASTRSTSSPDPAASARRTIATERQGLDALHDALDAELNAPFAAAVLAISGCGGRVVVTGMGKSGHVGRKIAATFASTGTPAHFVHPAEASHGDLGMIQPSDVVLALSWSGETAEMAVIVAHCARFRVPLVAITSNGASALGAAADVALVLPKAQEACPNGLAPTTSTTMQLALGDALAVALLETRGFTATDFRVYHPGGKLGAQLKQVHEIMHRGEHMPLVAADATMAQAVTEMSAKGFGCTFVTQDGQLVGVVTDGDLRRHMGGANFLARPVAEMMTRRPVAIAPETLVAEALEIVERMRIGAIAVARDGRPVGIAHVLDLLKAGAA